MTMILRHQYFLLSHVKIIDTSLEFLIRVTRDQVTKEDQ